MKHRRACLCLLALAVVVAPAWAAAQAADAEVGAKQPLEAPAKTLDLRREPVVRGDAQAGEAKAGVCVACHGPDGNAVAPAFPSLAGQPATYLYVQLRAYREDTRVSDVMRPFVEPLSAQEMKDLAAHYAAQAPTAAAGGGGAGDATRGGTLYMQGDATAGVPPCQGCHGADGRAATSAAASIEDSEGPGTAWHTWPALAGQQPAYVVAQLQAFRSGARAETTNARIMQGVARRLDDGAMADLAAYVAGLP
jgi:cytochrome c553